MRSPAAAPAAVPTAALSYDALTNILVTATTLPSLPPLTLFSGDLSTALRRSQRKFPSLVRAASRIDDALVTLLGPLFPHAHINESFTWRSADDMHTLAVEYRWSSRVAPHLFEWALGLTERNMQPLHATCREMQWDREEKRSELSHADARLLIVYATTTTTTTTTPSSRTPVAFAHIRFDMDDNVPVLYLYELQIEPSMHRKGLGRILMLMVLALAWHARMHKVVLTVFHHNTPAMHLYKQGLGFQVDETDPNEHPNEHDYQILSQSHPAIAAAAATTRLVD